jgi:hypothetical protein
MAANVNPAASLPHAFATGLARSLLEAILFSSLEGNDGTTDSPDKAADGQIDNDPSALRILRGVPAFFALRRSWGTPGRFIGPPATNVKAPAMG